MKLNTGFILIEEFDLEAITVAFRQGRLYLKTDDSAENAAEKRAAGIRDIMEYVARIDDCASAPYTSKTHAIWKNILHSEELTDLFFYHRYASSRGKVNWYRVNVVICLLREMGVYREEFTGVELHCRCERSAKRNAHYTGMSRYLLERSEIVTLKNLLKNTDINLNTEISE